jgi:hypothetical protein
MVEVFILLISRVSVTFAIETVSTTMCARWTDASPFNKQPPKSTNTGVVPRIYGLRPGNE